MRSTFGSRVARAGLPTISGLLGVPLYRGLLVSTQRTFFQFRCLRLRELQGYGRRAPAYGSWRICGFLVLTRCTRDASALDTANFAERCATSCARHCRGTRTKMAAERLGCGALQCPRYPRLFADRERWLHRDWRSFAAWCKSGFCGQPWHLRRVWRAGKWRERSAFRHLPRSRACSPGARCGGVA